MSQIGYVPSSEKRLFLDAKYANADFKVVNNQSVVFEGVVTPAKEWPASGTAVCYADFSALQKDGQYSLLIGGVSLTDSILIKSDIYHSVSVALVKSYYMARASQEIFPRYAGDYARLAGHIDNKVIVHPSAASKQRPAGFVFSSPGGWYDAGDYNKYIVNSGISTYELLHAYDLFGAQLEGFNTNIPESGNGVSDLIDETIYNLRWMLTMQDPNDGGVYHKLTSKSFTGMELPNLDSTKRYVVSKTTAATLDFAATMAKAYRVLLPLSKAFPSLADSCISCSKSAYKWALLHPDIQYVQASDIHTGQYEDNHLSDEWFWASMELFYSTHHTSYLNQINLATQKFTNPNWADVNTLALFSLVSINGRSGLSADNETLLNTSLVTLADKYLHIYKSSAYRVSLDTFPWGSNGELANQGVLLMHAYLITKNREYLNAADAAANYLLGANPLGYCFITSFGKKSPKHIHDRRSEGDHVVAPIPGLLVGGPTTQARSDCGEGAYLSAYPALSYSDLNCSYSTNEIAINWNASAALLFIGLDILHADKK